MNRSLVSSGVALLALAVPALAAGPNTDATDREPEVRAVSAGSEANLVLAVDRGPADTLYQAARRALNRGEYKRALDLLGQLQREEPDSEYAPEVMYWQAFALSKIGGRANLRKASRLLNLQEERYPESTRSGDAATLATRVRTELARQGDAESAAGISQEARAVAEVERDQARVRRDQARVQRDQARVQRDQVRMQRGQEAGDDEMKSAALNALMQVSPDKALPILKQVLANREGNSDALRAQTMFILSQIDSPETFDIMLDAVRNDPSSKVREQAVFWLSKVDSPRAYEALAEILQDPGYSELHQNAIFSLSQSSDPRAHGVLRDYAADASASAESRNAAIHWLGQRPSDENAAFLRDLYSTIPNAESRGQILYALSLMKGHGNAAWLMERALDANEDIELRKIALHWAGQSGEVQMAALIALYDRTDDRDVKEQLIFVYSRRDEAAAMDKLLEIARTEADPELRKNAIFWIGQSGDPRAEEVLLEILTQ